MAQPTAPLSADLRLAQRPPSGVRRSEWRYQCGPATPGRLIIDPGAEPVRAWVLNLSTHGAGLLIPAPLPAQTEIVICMKSASAGRVFQFDARIAHCSRQVGGDWLIGCELLTPLSA